MLKRQNLKGENYRYMKILFRKYYLVFIICTLYSCTDNSTKINIDKIDEYYTDQKNIALSKINKYEDLNTNLMNCLSKKKEYRRIDLLRVVDTVTLDLWTADNVIIKDKSLEDCMRNNLVKELYTNQSFYSCKVKFKADTNIIEEMEYLTFIDDINPFTLNLKYSIKELGDINNTRMRREFIKPNWYFELIYKF